MIVPASTAIRFPSPPVIRFFFRSRLLGRASRPPCAWIHVAWTVSEGRAARAQIRKKNAPNLGGGRDSVNSALKRPEHSSVLVSTASVRDPGRSEYDFRRVRTLPLAPRNRQGCVRATPPLGIAGGLPSVDPGGGPTPQVRRSSPFAPTLSVRSGEVLAAYTQKLRGSQVPPGVRHHLAVNPKRYPRWGRHPKVSPLIFGPPHPSKHRWYRGREINVRMLCCWPSFLILIRPQRTADRPSKIMKECSLHKCATADAGVQQSKDRPNPKRR